MQRQFLIWNSFLASTIPICCEDTSQAIGTSQTPDSPIIPCIQLPFKIPPRQSLSRSWHDSINFTTPPPKYLIEDTSTFFGYIVKGKSYSFNKNKRNNQSPILYTLDKEREMLDSLALFDKPCYSYISDSCKKILGVDSDYLPWIEITKDLTVIRTDTSYKHRLEQVECVPPRGSMCPSFVTDTLIMVDKFIIDNNGQITKAK